jgi:hypothetical protein
MNGLLADRIDDLFGDPGNEPGLAGKFRESSRQLDHRATMMRIKIRSKTPKRKLYAARTGARPPNRTGAGDRTWFTDRIQ